MSKETKGSVRLDMYDPKSFRVLQIGDEERSENVWSGTPEEAKECKARLKYNLRRILQGYRGHAESQTHAAGDVMAATQARRAGRLDVKQELKEIMSGMERNSARVLGRPEFKLSDLDDMATFTSDDLRGWLVYFGLIFYKDGSMKGYVGSSVAMKGSGVRLVDTYEKPLQYAELGIFKSALGGSGLARHAAGGEIEAVHVRPLFSSTELPNDPRERVRAGAKDQIPRGDHDRLYADHGHLRPKHHYWRACDSSACHG